MTMLNGLPLLDIVPTFEDKISFKYNSRQSSVESGKRKTIFPDLKAQASVNFTYRGKSKADAIALASFWESVSGPGKSFWLPSWKNQLGVIGSPRAGAATITMPTIGNGYGNAFLSGPNPGYASGAFIYLHDFINPPQFHRVAACVTAGGIDTLTLDPPLAINFTARRFLCGMVFLMRFGEDKLEETWLDENTLEAKLSFVETINFRPDPEPQTILSGYGYLAPFDFAILRYIWTDTNGQDLDTRTAFINTDPSVNEETVGWSEGNQVIDAERNPLLTWGGDNIQHSGNEAVLIDFKTAAADFPGISPITIRMRAYWYNAKYDGNIVLQFQTFLGGAMVPFTTDAGQTDWNNVGGVLVQNINVNRSVNAPAGTNVPGTFASVPGDELGDLQFNPITKTATITSP